MIFCKLKLMDDENKETLCAVVNTDTFQEATRIMEDVYADCLVEMSMIYINDMTECLFIDEGMLDRIKELNDD